MPFPTESIPPVALGFALGLRHALDPDHLVAMATIVTRERRWLRSIFLGGFWGLGHSASLLAVGIVVALLRVPVPPAWSRAFELAVAGMLVLLGFRALLARPSGLGAESAHRPFAVGVMHGLAGSGALTLLVLAGSPSVAAGLATIALFGLGSVGGMMLMSGLFALPSALTAPAGLAGATRIVAGLASIALGVYYGYVAA